VSPTMTGTTATLDLMALGRRAGIGIRKHPQNLQDLSLIYRDIRLL
jgi:hypothetical protein